MSEPTGTYYLAVGIAQTLQEGTGQFELSVTLGPGRDGPNARGSSSLDCNAVRWRTLPRFSRPRKQSFSRSTANLQGNFQDLLVSISDACCQGPGDECVDGLPTTCSTTCAS